MKNAPKLNLFLTQKRTDPKGDMTTDGKDRVLALILCVFLGYLGIHRFYLGFTGSGTLYLMTLGLFGIGWLIDIILLIIPNGLIPQTRSVPRG